MKITAAQWEKLNSLFQASADLDIQSRGNYLDTHCPDPVLRNEIDRLIYFDSQNENPIGGKISREAVTLLSTVRIGETLGSYTIDREIGRGGMGTVYLASRSDDSFDKRVAIKILHNKIASEEQKSRFKDERQTLANMEHPNIARLLDGGACIDGSPYLVMEYVEGESIDAFCKHHQLPLRKRIAMLIQVGNAIQYAHRHQILHCDIKPGNIIVRPDGLPKLLDFGISQLLRTRKAKHSNPYSAQYLQMTPAYASPEQIAGDELDERSDVYSLGILLHEILTGNNLTNKQNLTTDLPDFVQGKSNRDLRAILNLSVEKDKGNRYPSIKALLDDLSNYLDNRPVLARKKTIHYRLFKFFQRNPAPLSAILLLILTSLPFYYYNFIDQFPADKIVETIKYHSDSMSESRTLKVAVLKFTSNEERGIANQLTENLILDLSRLKHFHIIANNTIKRTRPSDIETSRLKETLGIDYYVKGNIKLKDNIITLDLSLFDTSKTSPIWQGSFNRHLTELNSLQKNIRVKIVESFNLDLTEKEWKALNTRHTASREAYEYFSQGLYHYGQRFPEANRKARENILKSIEIDPDFARAYAVLANTYRIEFISRWSENPNQSLHLANEYIAKALALDADLPQAHFVNGLIYRDQGLHEQAMVSAANAIALNPSYADAFILLASSMCYTHIATDSVKLIKKAIRLNPDHPINYKFHLGQCQYMSGNTEDAIQTFEEAIERNPTAQRTNIWLTVSYVRAGRIQDAEWVVEELLSWNPSLTVGHIKAVTPFTHPEDIRDFEQNLLLAGFPE